MTNERAAFAETVNVQPAIAVARLERTAKRWAAAGDIETARVLYRMARTIRRANGMTRNRRPYA